MTDPQQPEHLCVVCQHRQYERAQVCNPCRRWLAADLGRLAGLTLLLPAAAIPANGSEGGLPVRVDAVDLDLRISSDQPVHDEHGDQTGHVPVAAVLGGWVRDWIETRRIGEHMPPPAVGALAGWLLYRLEDECDQHPAIDDFAREVRKTLAAVERVLSTSPPQTVRFGLPCPRCGTQTLRRVVGGDWIECGDCGRLWDEHDYAAMVRDIVPGEKLLTAAQVATMNGWTRDAVYKRVSRGQLAADIGPWGGMMFRKADVVPS